MSKLVGDGGRLGLATTLAMLATWLSAAPGFAAPQRAVANEVIVGFRQQASVLERERAVAAVEGRVKSRLRGIGAVLVRAPGSVGRMVERLERRAGVRYAEPNFRLFAETHGGTPNDPDFHRLWGLHNFGQLVNFSFGTPDADIDAPEAWEVTTGGDSVVGVLDTGIDANHPDLAANVWTNSGEDCAGCRSDGVDNDGNGYVDDWRGWDFANDDNNPTDDNGHGTHVAGTIAAVGNNGVGVVGVNWSAELMALKFIGADGSGTTADAIAALLYATDNGATVTNNSYGTADFSQAFADAVRVAGERGSLFVAAAGNSFSSNDATPQYPASFTDPNVVAVAATNNADQRAWFSNFGARSVDLGAPGDGIYSTWPGGGYQLQSGTSMAAPQVAGAAALVQAAFPGAVPAGTKALLLRTVDANASLAGKTTSGGRLNVNAAVRCNGAGQAWLESPAPGFVAQAGEELRVTALAAGCGRTGAVTVTATANGAPIALTARGGGVYDGTYTPTQPGGLSISVTAEGPAGSDTRTVSGSVPARITAGGPAVTVRAAAPDENPQLGFNGSAGERVSLQIDAVTIGTSNCCGAKVSIAAPDGSAVGSPIYVGTTGAFIDTRALTQTGGYTIFVDPQGSATGSATLTLYSVPPDATAAILPGGPAVSVATTTPGQNATLTFDASAGDRISANVSPVCCNAKVSIVAPDGSAVGSPTFLGTTGAFIDTRALPQSGRYAIVVDPSGPATGSATVTLYSVPPDVTAAIMPGGPAVSVTTTTPGQNAALSFDANAGERVSVKVGPLCCNAKLSIVAPDGSAVGPPMFMGPGGGFIDSRTLSQSGRHAIVIDPSGTATGGATVTVYAVPADVTKAISPGGPSASVTTTTPGQNAKLTFSGTTGQRVSLNIGPICCNTYVSMLAPDGTMLGSSSYITTAGGFIEPRTLPQNGTYTIVLDHAAAALGTATVTVYDVPPDLTATIVPGGQSTSVTTTAPGQNAKLSFSGVAGQRVSLKAGPACCGISVSIVAPDGSALGSSTSVVPGGLFIDTQTLPQTGTYTVPMDVRAGATGSVTLTLYDVPPNLSPTISIGGPPVTLTIPTPGQNAAVTFDGNAGRTVTLQISGVTITQAKLLVTNPDGTDLMSPQYVFASPKTLTAALRFNGTHTIFVDPVNAYVGSMTLALP